MDVKKISEFDDLPSVLATGDDILVERGGVGYKLDFGDYDATLVKLSGDQTVAGVKTFSSSPVVPDTPSGGTAAINKNYADSVYSIFPVGMVTEFAGASAPTGWLLCQGQEVLRTSYAPLDAVIGTTYGSYTNGSGGAGTTHMRLPDLRGRSPVGAGTSADINPDTDSGTHVAETWNLGKSKNDRGQGHIHQMASGASLGVAQGTYSVTNAGVSTPTGFSGPFTDGTNGTPRTGATTRAKGLALNYIIKI